MASRISEAEKREMAKRFEDGMPYREIAAVMGRSPYSTRKILRSMGYSNKKVHVIGEPEYLKIVGMLENGEDPREVARKVGRASNTIHTINRELLAGERRKFDDEGGKIANVKPPDMSDYDRNVALLTWGYPPGLKEHLAELRQ